MIKHLKSNLYEKSIVNERNKSLGIFDSGIGGLTVLCEILKANTYNKIVYFGDTGRVPYGTRSVSTIIDYARQDVRFLLSKDVTEIAIACGTVSSNAIEELRNEFEVPIIGVIDPAARKAIALSKNRIIGVIGTQASIKSGAYEKALKSITPNIHVISVACPLLVPLVEYGFIKENEEITKMTCERYLQPIVESGADTLIMGCTHFPIIENHIRRCFDRINLVNVGSALSEEINNNQANYVKPSISYYVSDDIELFKNSASIFVKRTNEILNVERINIDRY